MSFTKKILASLTETHSQQSISQINPKFFSSNPLNSNYVQQVFRRLRFYLKQTRSSLTLEEIQVDVKNTMLIALIYFKRITTKTCTHPGYIARLYLICVILAVKMLEDDYMFSFKAFSAAFCVRANLLHKLEIDCLIMIKHELHVSEKEFEHFATPFLG